MPDLDKTQPDRNLAAEQRPVPSQAEGDRETVEEDLNNQEKIAAAEAQGNTAGGKAGNS